MTSRQADQEAIAKGLAALEDIGEPRIEDRRRFSRREQDEGEPGLLKLQAAVEELRERVDDAHDIRRELVGASEVVAALRAELKMLQAELAAERIASRRARMQVAWLEAELRRRQETEDELRAQLALTDCDLAPVPHASEKQPAIDQAAISELRAALAELSGQQDLDPPSNRAPVPGAADDFDAAAARLRARTSPVTAACGQVRLAPRGIREAAGAWLRDGLTALAVEDPARAERLMVALLAAQAGCADRPLSYGLSVRGGGSYRVSVMQQGAAVGALSQIALDGRVEGPLHALIPLATGGGSSRLAGARVRGRYKLRALLTARRRPVQLSELALLLHPLAPKTLLEVAVLAVQPSRVDRDATVDVICEGDVSRVVCRTGELPVVIRAGTTAADATIHASTARLAAVLAGQDEVAVDGDASAVAALLSWLDARP